MSNPSRRVPEWHSKEMSAPSIACISNAFDWVESFYGERKAERSGVPLIEHIKEGVFLLNRMNADPFDIAAYCLHPLFQPDKELRYNLEILMRFQRAVVVQVMEYRNQANAWLSEKVSIQNGKCVMIDEPTPGPLPGVRNMLIADKIQNYKDFLIYHKETHPRSAELDFYFRAWLDALGISLPCFHSAVDQINTVKQFPSFYDYFEHTMSNGFPEWRQSQFKIY